MGQAIPPASSLTSEVFIPISKKLNDIGRNLSVRLLKKLEHVDQAVSPNFRSFLGTRRFEESPLADLAGKTACPSVPGMGRI